MSGLEERFYVTRRDGRDLPGGDREGTCYFVLDPANDEIARIALGEYAYNTLNRELASDLYEWLESLDN
jgi:hypothetical protein